MLSSSWDGQPFGHNRHGPKIGDPFSLGGAGAPSNTMWPGPSPTFIPSGILIHPAVRPQQTWAKNWGELGHHLTQCGLGQGLPPYQVASWSIQPFGHNRHGPKIGGCSPLREGDLGPHLTQCGRGRGLSPYHVSYCPSNRLAIIHQCHKQDRQTDRQDNSLIAQGKPFRPKTASESVTLEINWKFLWKAI